MKSSLYCCIVFSFQKLVAQMKQDPQVTIYFYTTLFTLKNTGNDSEWSLIVLAISWSSYSLLTQYLEENRCEHVFKQWLLDSLKLLPLWRLLPPIHNSLNKVTLVGCCTVKSCRKFLILLKLLFIKSTITRICFFSFLKIRGFTVLQE